jgi:hypothetical protein
MNDINWRLLGLSALLVLAGQTCAWIQFNTQFKYPKYGPEWWGWYVVAIPSTWFFLKSAQFGVEAMGGSLWANRFLGFTMGIIVYAILTNYFFQQPITLKIGIQIGLALCVMMVQIFMK